MLQRLLIITLTLCSLTASAQWQQTGAKVRYVNGLGIPTKDTAAGVAADSSQILIRPADSSLYIKYKRTWVKVGAGGGGTIGGSGTINRVPKFTASTTLGNSSIVDSASAVAMTISPSGKVGIGTTTPSQKLSVSSGNLLVNNGLSPDSNSGIRIVAPISTTHYNWMLAAQQNVTGAFEITPSTAVGGTTFTNPALVINSTGNVGIGYTAPATKLSVNGTTLINTNTDNGVDKLQVNGGASISSLLKVTGGGIRLGVAGTEQSLSCYLGGTNDAYPLVNNAYVVSGVGWKYLGNGPASMIGYVSSDLIYYNAATNSSGADASLGTWTERFMVKSGGNVLIATTTDNGVDKLQVNGSIYSSTTLKGNDISIVGTGSIPTLTSTQFTTQSFSALTTAKTANYTTAFNDYFIDCTSGTFTVTLQAAASYQGRVLIIKNSGAGTITVDGNGSETIDGATTYSLSVQYATVQIMSDGTNWKIISKF